MRFLGVFGALEAISSLVQGIGGAETGKGHQEGLLAFMDWVPEFVPKVKPCRHLAMVTLDAVATTTICMTIIPDVCRV